MRLTAPLVAGAAIVLAIALVAYFRPQPQASLVPNAAEQPQPAAQAAADVAPRGGDATPAERTPVFDAAPIDASAAVEIPEVARSPLPGETPATPMAQMLADRQQDLIVRDNADAVGLPPGLVEGEREFAAEPVDGTWAPGAEANLLATFAQMPGLELIDLQVECRSTMCRVQLTQPTGSAAQGGGPMPFNILRDEIGLTPRWMMAVVVRPGAPTAKSVAYLWREGFAPERETGAARDAD